jgi:HD-GYP domain-containing protein (c-di-GMP phosphodiesterase class II)
MEAPVGEDSPEERLLLGIADQALLTLENERLLESERRTLDAVVACLGRALAVRHERTAEHSDRLTVDCTAVARRLGMSGERLRDVAFAAALHDLGKIGIPERVLDNRGALGPEDWRLIHTHPELGARIIDPVPALAGTAELIRACHEHHDGSGYPRGLRGEEIPLGAMVVFTCDAYHAMREDRPYQAPLSEPEARRRLGELSGVHFAPRVVEALLAHLDHERPSPGGA